MKKFSKLLALTLVCVMLLGAVPVSAANDDTNTAVPISAQVFDDVAPDAWYYEAVNTMAQGGLLAGYSDGLFHPDDPITYGQFATILCRITGQSTEYYAHYDSGIYCTVNHWALGAMLHINSTHIFSKACKNADEPLWRAEALESLAALASKMPKYNYSYDTQISDKIWTWDDIADADIVQNVRANKSGSHTWAWPTILQAYNLGITSGVDSAGTCNPTKTMTRAELCQMLYNMGISGANSVKITTSSGLVS